MKKLFSFVLVVILLITCGALAACNKVADNTEHYDKITKTLKLSKSYEGKSFLVDGIGRATVEVLTDGDTTRFTLEDGSSIVIRYYHIDTPESTGSVEKWGKAASAFVKERLSGDVEIVLESSTGGAPTVDSYGSRFLGYVWYKRAGDADFKCLNLEIVENGFSENKGQYTSAYPYNEYFEKATKFARSIKLRIYSELDDPLYSTEPIAITIKEINDDINSGNSKLYFPDTEAGEKVEFTACITSVKLSSQTYSFTATDYDPATGKEETITLYAGYASANESKIKVGHMYHIVGFVDIHNGSLQIKGMSYSTRYQRDELTYVTQRNYYYIFDSNLAYMDNYSQALFTHATVKSSKVENGVLTITATAYQRNNGGQADEATTFTFKVKVAGNYVNELTEGTLFSVRGYQLTEKSNTIDIVDYSNIHIKTN